MSLFISALAFGVNGFTFRTLAKGATTKRGQTQLAVVAICSWALVPVAILLGILIVVGVIK